jgi:hypothetical protein
MRGIKNILQSYALPTKHQDYSQINLLVEKLEGSLTCEDKLATFRRLYDLISQDAAAKSTFSSLAFPIFCRLLREDASNATIVRASLECVAAAICARDGMSQQVSNRIQRRTQNIAIDQGIIDSLSMRLAGTEGDRSECRAVCKDERCNRFALLVTGSNNFTRIGWNLHHSPVP